MSNDKGEQYNGPALIRAAKKLRTEALTSSRIYMEAILPRMEKMLEEFDAEERKLRSQTTISRTMSRFNSRLANNLRRSKKQSQPKTSNPSSTSGLLLLPREETSVPNLRTRAYTKFSNSNNADISNSSLMNGTPKKIRAVASLNDKSTKSLPLNDKDFSPKAHLKVLLQQRKELEVALTVVKEKAKPIVRRSKIKGGVCGIYHPAVGDLEWIEKDHGSVFGVWNLLTKKIEWRVDASNSIAGVFNPETSTVEWRTVFNGSVCGVLNPISNKVEWHIRRRAGVFAVFNPVTETVEVNENPNGAIVGWYDDKKEKVVWEMEEVSCLCVIVRDYNRGGYITACSNFTGWRR